MRTLSAQDSVLLPTNTYATHARLWVEQPGAADAGTGANWVCLSDYPGLGDLTISITRGETVDDPCASLQATLCRDFGLYSLSPEALRSPLNLVGGSFVPLIKGGRGIRLYVAISPSGAAPNTDAWHLKFDGHIDTLDLASGDSTIGIQARDLGGRLQATQIEASRVYGSDSGVPLEDVIQGILDDNNTGVTLVVPASPGWDLHKYQQDKTNVMDAIRALASQIGWELRYRWNAGASRFDLTLWDIDRAKTSVDDTITPAQVRSWKSANEDVTTIRNVVTVVYKVDTTTGERSSYTASDSTSIADNGRMACEVVEDASSQIDDEATATRMANAILADLKDTLIAGSADTIPRPHVELGDLLTFTADNTPLPRWSDIDQTLAVVGVQDDFTAEVSTTSLSLRGKPSGGFERWLQLEARKGVGSNRALVTVDGASGAAATATLGGITVVYDQPAAVNWVYSEIHLSPVSGFTPSAATLQYRGKSTSYTIGGLVPGATYYVKIVVVDSAGNRSTASSQTIVAAALVGPGHVDHAGELDPPVPNGTFSVTSPPSVLGAVPPDNWTTWAHSIYTPYNFDLPGVWDHGVALDTTSAGTTSGNAAIRFTAPSFTQPSGCNAYGIRSSLIPVIEGEQYVCYIKANVDPSTVRPQVGVIWYDVNKAYLSHQLAATSGTADNTWKDFNFTSFSTAIGARFASVIILVAQPGLTGGQTFVVDDVQFGRYAHVHPGDFVDVTTNQLVAGQKTLSKLVASKTLNSSLTTDLLNVTRDDPATPDLKVDENGNVALPNGATTGGTLVVSGAQGLVQVKRENVNNIFAQVVPAVGSTNGVEWWGTSTQNYGALSGQIGDFGNLYWWNQTSGRIEWGLNPSTGMQFSRGLMGTGTRVMEVGADGWMTTPGAAGKYEETAHKDATSGYVGRGADDAARLPGSTAGETFAVGGLAAQSFGAGNYWWGGNWHYASGHKRISADYAFALMQLAGDVTLRTADTGAAGSAIAGDGNIGWKVDKSGYFHTPTQPNLAYVATDANGKLVAAAAPLTNPMTTLGDALYGGAAGAPTRLPGPTTNGTYVLSTVTAGGAAAAPAWLGVTQVGGASLVPQFDSNGQFTAVTTLDGGFHVFEKSNADTTSRRQVLRVHHKTSADMADGFGAQINFAVTDSSTTLNQLAAMGAGRDGADNSGKIALATANAGAFTDWVTIDHLGTTALLGPSVTCTGTIAASNISTAGGANTIPQSDANGQVAFSTTLDAGFHLFEKSNADTNINRGILRLQHTTSGDMVDGFGGNFAIAIKDNAGVSNPIAIFGAARDGADNSGKLSLKTYNAGTASDWLTVDHLGATALLGPSVTCTGTIAASNISTAGGANTIPQAAVDGSVTTLYTGATSQRPFCSLAPNLNSGAFAYYPFGVADSSNNSAYTYWVHDSVAGNRYGGINVSGDGLGAGLMFKAGGVVGVGSLTASKLVATDASKNLTSLAYSTAGGANTIPQLDANGCTRLGYAASAPVKLGVTTPHTDWVNLPGYVSLGSTTESTGDGFLQLGTATFVSGNNHNLWSMFGQNLAVKSTGSANAYYTPYGGSAWLGYRGFSLTNDNGLEYFADTAAATAGATVTPTRRFRCADDGTFTISGAIAATGANLSGLTASLPIVTDGSKNLASGAWGTTAGTFCQGNAVMQSAQQSRVREEGSTTTIGSSYTDVVFVTEALDALGECDKTVFTAAAAGIYSVSWSVRSGSVVRGATDTFYSSLSKNNGESDGSIWVGTVDDARVARTDFPKSDGSVACVDLAAGDTLRIKAINTSSNATALSGSRKSNYFCITRVG